MIERFRRSWLGDHIVEYLAGLAAQGYSKVTLEGKGRNLVRFAKFAERGGATDLAHLPESVGLFLAQLPLGQHWIIQWRSLLNRFVRHLRGRGLVPAVPPSGKPEPFGDLVAEYAAFLAEHRGMSHDGIAGIQSCGRAFLRHTHVCGITDLGAISPAVIHEFIAAQGKHYARRTMGDRCSMLRGFLSFLHLRSLIPTDLSVFVVAPRVFAHERCPRFLTRPEIRAVLSSIDRRTPLGRRDYAMLLLLSTYGLRGIEVVRLRLEDIDWRNERIRIRARKAGNETVYPLAPSVGRALLAYLERGRPKSPDREVFVTRSAPFRAIARSASVGRTARTYFAKAGIHVERPGAHTFRYSCAQALLQDQTPLKTIADYLGHRALSSTHRYTMIALDDLRGVAMGDVEDLL